MNFFLGFLDWIGDSITKDRQRGSDKMKRCPFCRTEHRNGYTICPKCNGYEGTRFFEIVFDIIMRINDKINEFLEGRY